MKASRRSWRSVLDSLVSLAVIALCGSLVWSRLSAKPRLAVSQPSKIAARRPAAPPPTVPVSLKGASTKGSASATVALIEYSDFQCPFCGVFARTTLPEIDERYVKSGKVLLVFRDLPLDTIHPTAMIAAQAGRCAEDQGQFWPMHDWMFANQRQLTLTTLTAQARDLHVDPAVFTRCLYADGAARVRAEQAEAKVLQVDSTPTFFVGLINPDRSVTVAARLVGAKTVEAMTAALDALLSKSARKP